MSQRGRSYWVRCFSPLTLMAMVNGAVGGFLIPPGPAALVWICIWCPLSGFVVGLKGFEWADRHQDRISRAKWRARLDALERLHDRDMARWN